MSILRLLGSRKPRKLPEPEQLPQEVNGQLHVEFRSTVRQLVVVRSCLNEDGEASVELPPESPASDGEEEEGGEHESEALNATAVLLVREHQIVSVALDVARTSACGSGGSTNQRTGCGHSGLSHPISYQLTVFVSGGSGKMTTEHSLSSQTKPRPSLEGREAEHPKSSKAGLGVFESLLEKTGRLKLRERWSAAVKQSTRFFITLNSSHEDPEREFRLLGPVELPVGTSWLSAIMEGQPDLEWVVLNDPTIFAGITNILTHSRNDGFEDHAATVFDYAKRWAELGPCYGSQLTSEQTQLSIQRAQLTRRMEEYVVLACYPHMWSRVAHWSSMASLCRLGMIGSTTTDSQGVVKTVLDRAELFRSWYQERLASHGNGWIDSTNSKKDSRLLGESTTFFKYNGQQSCTFFGNESLGFTRLQEVNSKPLACQRYTADTCYEFHQFLVLALCNYFTTLRNFKIAANKVIKTARKVCDAPSPNSLAQLIAPAKILRTRLHLLWSIVESKTFDWHLQLLCAEGGLQRASRNLAGMMSFAGDSTLVWTPHPVPEPEAFCGKLNSVSEWESQAAAEGALDQRPLVGMSRSGPPVSKEVLDAFRRWCRLHSSYLQAVYALPYATKDAFAGDSEVHYSILRSPPRGRAPLETWRDTIDRVCRTQHAPEHIATLQAALERAMRAAMAQYDAQVPERKARQAQAASLTRHDASLGPSQATQLPIQFPTQGNSIVGPSQATIQFKLNPVMACLAGEIIHGIPQSHFSSVHCEAELAAYLGDNANPTTIAVSKRCCSFCWRFMKRYPSIGPPHKVRGQHDLIFPLDLPASTRADVIKGLLMYYNHMLYTSLGSLAALLEKNERPPTSRHSRSVSYSSGYSVDTYHSNEANRIFSGSSDYPSQPPSTPHNVQ